jgi:hypothetical protein
MTSPADVLRPVRLLWMTAWPLWTLSAFAGLAVVRVLPSGYARAAVSVPVLLLVPGSLVLGALFAQQRRPRGSVFVCISVLLSVACSVFASLALYVLTVSITAASTYWCLLAVSAALAIGAELRLLAGRPGTVRRAAREREPDPAPSDADDGERAVRVTGSSLYPIIAVLAGMSLLAGVTFAWDHVSHPAPAGYTWMAWTGPSGQSATAVGPAGGKLGFQIVHRESGTGTFRLTAAWQTSPSRALAAPLTLTIGPDKTVRGALVVPPLPTGCNYRIVVTLTAVRQTGTWSMNADVHEPGKPLKGCA